MIEKCLELEQSMTKPTCRQARKSDRGSLSEEGEGFSGQILDSMLVAERAKY